MCVIPSERCDGLRHCPKGDDEWLCDVTCPSGCTCIGLSYLCSDGGFSRLPMDLPPNLRKLDLTGNTIDLRENDLDQFSNLGELILGKNGIRNISAYQFSSLYNLYKLDLSNNQLTVIKKDTFYGLQNLRILVLSGNMHLTTLQAGSFIGLSRLPSLRLRDLGILDIEVGTFKGLKAIRQLDISQNDIGKLPEDVFQELGKLTDLNISHNPNLVMTRSILGDLLALQFLQSDHFKHCCFVGDRLPEENCLPKRDELSSCEDLMRRDILKAFLWILGLMALLCNAFVLFWRGREKTNVYGFSVLNLAAADFIMGVYMVTLAVVDAYYRGVYIEYADEWRQSWVCQLLGVLNTISSEASVFMLCVISADRFYNIVFPFKAMRTASSALGRAKIVMVFVWSFAFTLAIIPVLPFRYFEGGYYSRSGMCISIHLTNEYAPGWQFSVAIFHGLNFMSFVFIFLSYAYMYKVVVDSQSSTGKQMGKARASEAEVKLARRITLVVATDFLCWVPINIMGT